MKTKTAAVLLAAAMLVAWVPTGFGGIGLEWSMGSGWMCAWGEDPSIPSIDNLGAGVAQSTEVVWQLIYAGADGRADYPDVENNGGGWISGDDQVIAERIVPQGGGVASDGTEWNEFLEYKGGNSPIYVDLDWYPGAGYVYQRIYQGTPAYGIYYFESGLFTLNPYWDPIEPVDKFAAAPEDCGVCVDTWIPLRETQTTPVPVPYDWLEENASAILAANYWDYEAAATACAANGRAVWECYVANISVTDADAEFRALLGQEDGQWLVKWSPDRGYARTYTVEGATDLGTWWTPLSADSRFFRVKVSLPNGAGGEILSANAVGYVKHTIQAGQMLSLPFDNPEREDGAFKFGETDVARKLPVGSVVYFWEAAEQKWNGGMKSRFGWDPAESNRVLQAGEGFCVLNPTGEDIEVTVGGEVQSDELLSRTYCGNNAWSVMANPYPVDVKFGDTALASQLRKGDQVCFWNPDMQSWESVTKSVKGWYASASNRVLDVGAAFFIRSSERGVWESAKPYTWP